MLTYWELVKKIIDKQKTNDVQSNFSNSNKAEQKNENFQNKQNTEAKNSSKYQNQEMENAQKTQNEDFRKRLNETIEKSQNENPENQQTQNNQHGDEQNNENFNNQQSNRQKQKEDNDVQEGLDNKQDVKLSMENGQTKRKTSQQKNNQYNPEGSGKNQNYPDKSNQEQKDEGKFNSQEKEIDEIKNEEEQQNSLLNKISKQDEQIENSKKRSQSRNSENEMTIKDSNFQNTENLQKSLEDTNKNISISENQTPISEKNKAGKSTDKSFVQSKEQNENVENTENFQRDFKQRLKDAMWEEFEKMSDKDLKEFLQDLSKADKIKNPQNKNEQNTRTVDDEFEESVNKPEEKESSRENILKQLLDKIEDSDTSSRIYGKLNQLRDKNNKSKEQKVDSEKRNEIEHEEKEGRDSLKGWNVEVLKDFNEKIPDFLNRQKNNGYSVDTNDCETPDALIKMFIKKFLTQRFIKTDTGLNTRGFSLDSENGNQKYIMTKVITHIKTKEYSKVPNDKISYEEEGGTDENIPLAFYFDLSGSMSNYSAMLANIAMELVKNDVKVLMGFNEFVNVQINKIDKKMNTEDLEGFLRKIGSSSRFQKENITVDEKLKFRDIEYKEINSDLDKFLISAHAEKCVIFSDFDPKREVINLSKHAQTYWFCFESKASKSNIDNYNGFVCKCKDKEDIAEGLRKVSETSFKNLMLFDEMGIDTDTSVNDSFYM